MVVVMHNYQVPVAGDKSLLLTAKQKSFDFPCQIYSKSACFEIEVGCWECDVESHWQSERLPQRAIVSFKLTAPAETRVTSLYHPTSCLQFHGQHHKICTCWKKLAVHQLSDSSCSDRSHSGTGLKWTQMHQECVPGLAQLSSWVSAVLHLKLHSSLIWITYLYLFSFFFVTVLVVKFLFLHNHPW